MEKESEQKHQQPAEGKGDDAPDPYRRGRRRASLREKVRENVEAMFEPVGVNKDADNKEEERGFAVAQALVRREHLVDELVFQLMSRLERPIKVKHQLEEDVIELLLRHRYYLYAKASRPTRCLYIFRPDGKPTKHRSFMLTRDIKRKRTPRHYVSLKSQWQWFHADGDDDDDEANQCDMTDKYRDDDDDDDIESHTFKMKFGGSKDEAGGEKKSKV